MSLLNYLQYFAERKDKARERELQDSANQWMAGYDQATTPEARQRALAGINNAVPDVEFAAKLQDFILKRDKNQLEAKQRAGINQTYENLAQGKQSGGPLREGFSPLAFEDYTMPEALKMFAKYGQAGVEQFDKFAGSTQTANDAVTLANFRKDSAETPRTLEGFRTLQQKYPLLTKQADLATGLPKETTPYEGLSADYETFLRANGVPNSPQAYRAWQQDVIAQKRAGATKVSNVISNKVGEKGMTKLAEKMAENIVSRRSDVVDAANGLQTIAQAEHLLDAGVITGTGAEFLLNAGKALQRIGVKVDDDAISNTEAYTALMGKEVGSLIRMFGSGTGLSDADRQYAEKIAGGKISVNEKSLRRILAMNKKARGNLIKNYNREAGQAMSRPGADQLPFDLVVPYEESPVTPSLRQEAPPGAIKKLRENPGLANYFKKKYGYLPEGF